MLRLDRFLEWWCCIDFHFLFFSSLLPLPPPLVLWSCSPWASCPPCWGGPRFGNPAFLGSCSILQSLQLPSSRHLCLLLVQRPELDTTCWCFFVFHSNMFKYHVFSTLPNETQSFIAFGQLLEFELMISEKTVTQPSSRSWNWRKCKCYLVKEVLLRIFPQMHYITALCWSAAAVLATCLILWDPCWFFYPHWYDLLTYKSLIWLADLHSSLTHFVMLNKTNYWGTAPSSSLSKPLLPIGKRCI